MDARGPPALHVIILGSGGGPLENNCTAFLVRSVASGWSKGSIVAVDAGVHLSAIARILQQTQPAALGQQTPLPHRLTSGPFSGLELPFASVGANAAHVGRNLVDTYLITHPHLDHISGFVINTAAQPGSRPKRLAGLPSTIHAFKAHIFNNVIWPNLSDENNGAGLVSYMRLVEGGSPALGDGDGRGYLEICDGLAVKAWGVSHGHCMEKHSHRGSVCSSVGSTAGFGTPRYASIDAPSLFAPRGRRPTQVEYLHLSLPGAPALTTAPRTPSIIATGNHSSLPVPSSAESERMCVYDSSAYFLRDMATGREILIFGDVEPDSVSLSPRNYIIWQEAAPKIASGSLASILIECSYDNSQSNDRLYGHMKPEFIMEELWALGGEVEALRAMAADRTNPNPTKKRKFDADGAGAGAPGPGPGAVNGSGGTDGIMTRDGIRRRTVNTRGAPAPGGIGIDGDAVSPKTLRPPGMVPLLAAQEELMTPRGQPSPHITGATSLLSLRDAPPTPPSRRFHGAPLKGLKIVIIHVKDKLWDGPDVGETILQELQDEEAEMQCGAEFIISHIGQSLYL